ncbi:sugar ABC transporter permease [Alkalicella caledoniensis]|uniref:Xylose transport system permease protein XylH n=1 Tax=Alkalicella caledoniensis TaxID=2731377 RepID=A0A7G9W5R1_ALKCA|nr:sugar ABC transporter permease [Alkalicella caledoniensis]QNO14023.1 sugar ABC transporter permease [Alkalicella caledoniensis]
MQSKTNINDRNPLEIIKISLNNNIKQYMMFIALIGIMVIFSLLSDVFFTPRNLSTLFLQTAHIAILTCGVVLVIVAGHIDLSIGAVVGLTGAIVAILPARYGIGIFPAILITLAIGALIGLWQGYWVAYRQVPAFIVTLAGMMIFNGLLLGVTRGETIATQSSFNKLGQGYLPTMFFESGPRDNIPHDTTVIIWLLVILVYLFFEFRNRKERLKYEFEVLPLNLFVAKLVLVGALISAVFYIMAMYLGVPYSIILLMAVGAFYTFLTTKTTFGRHVYAIGGNKEAAKLSGINIKKRTLWIFISSGILGALGGIVYTARVGSAAASAGQAMELDVIAAAIIGGTSTLGGEGTIVGAIVGALVMSTLNNGMLLLDVGTTQRLIVRGLVLLLAVWVDISTRKKNS